MIIMSSNHFLLQSQQTSKILAFYSGFISSISSVSTGFSFIVTTFMKFLLVLTIGEVKLFYLTISLFDLSAVAAFYFCLYKLC